MPEQHQPEILHPNLARIATAYDSIIGRMQSHLLTPQEARAAIQQLEARDDEGTRWGIDPATGKFFHRTLHGDAQFATPPSSGFVSRDAYAYSATRGSAGDPNLLVELHAVDDHSLTRSASPVPGLHRNGPTPGTTPQPTRPLLPPAGIAAVAALIALILVLALALR